MNKFRGLRLDSTATLRGVAAAQLWLHRPTHHGRQDASTGPSDNWPVLVQHAEQGALFIDRERFTWQRVLCQNAMRSVVRVPVGELSLSGEPECLSLHVSILTEGAKSGNAKTLDSSIPSHG
jgi:hypothetical protein